MPALRSWMAPRRISSPVTRIAARGEPGGSADAPDLRRGDDPGAALAAEVLLLAGDFGGAILEWSTRLENLKARIYPLGVPDRFIEHGKREELLAELGISAEGIQGTVLRLTREASQLRAAP